MDSTAFTQTPGWYIEFQAALLRQAPRPGEIDQTTAEGWIGNQLGLKKNLFSCLVPKTELLLKTVGTVVILPNKKRFVARKSFKTPECKGVKIGVIYDSFADLFLDKIEKPSSIRKLHYHVVQPHASSKNDSIIANLGGKVLAETTLFDIFFLMKKQGNGDSGVLLANGQANVFYVKDVRGVIRSVDLAWHNEAEEGDHVTPPVSVGWGISADSDGWDGHSRVFSHAPLNS